MAWDTAANIISDAAAELGLVSAAIANPWASTDPNVFQLRTMLKDLGQDLARDHQWTHLQKTHTFATADGTAAYALPADFARHIDQTQWNRSTGLQLAGPASARDWQYLKASSAGGTLYKVLRTVNNEVQIHPTPSAVETVAFEYVSGWWVRKAWGASTAYVVGDRVVNGGNVYECDTAGTSASSGGPTGTGSNITDGTARWDYVSASAPTTDAPTVAGDTICFDRRLMVCGLRYYFLRAKGFDTTAVRDEYDSALARATGGDGAAPVLSLSPRSGERLIGPQNIPDTGYGE